MKSLLIAGALSLSSAIAAGTVDPVNPSLRAELLATMEADQAVRIPGKVELEQLHALDLENTARMKEIVSESGWPTVSLVGDDGAKAAWLLVQHADFDRPFQRKALSMMEELLASNEVRKQDVAYLRDRLSVADGEAQLYGTQGGCKALGRWEPAEIAEPEKVDVRRREMGLDPLATYVARASGYLCVEGQE